MSERQLCPGRLGNSLHCGICTPRWLHIDVCSKLTFCLSSSPLYACLLTTVLSTSEVAGLDAGLYLRSVTGLEHLVKLCWKPTSQSSTRRASTAVALPRQDASLSYTCGTFSGQRHSQRLLLLTSSDVGMLLPAQLSTWMGSLALICQTRCVLVAFLVPSFRVMACLPTPALMLLLSLLSFFSAIAPASLPIQAASKHGQVFTRHQYRAAYCGSVVLPRDSDCGDVECMSLLALLTSHALSRFLQLPLNSVKSYIRGKL